MVCDNYESTISIAAPGIPEKVDSTFQPLEDMKKHLKFMPSDKVGPEVNPAEMEFRFVSDRLTGPLTILHCADKYGLTENKSVQDVTQLCIHIVGSNVIEMLGIIKWEYIIHRLPKLLKLHLVFIGLELEMEDMDGENPDIKPCENCCDAGREIIYDIRKMPYESYCQNCPDFILPDMVCVFNCGFHEYSNEPEKETWKPALPFLTKFPGVPLLFTSYTLTEADKDLDLILKCSE